MGEFWKSIEPVVTGTVLALISALGLAARAWLQSRQRHWESAQEARQEAVQLGETFPGDVSEKVLEGWAMAALQRLRPKLSEDRARALVRKAAAQEPAPIPLVPPAERITLPGTGSEPPGSG